jgi:thiol-disulfide isomerase/thioredoxin
MKKLLLLVLAAALITAGSVQAAGDAKAELKELVAKVEIKLKAGKTTEKDLADELKQFDALLAQHKDEKTDDVAQILMLKAALYFQVFDNTEKGIAMVKQLKAEFPATQLGKKADEIIASVSKQEESKKISRSLVAGAKFPDFNETDLNGKPLSVGGLKGKVVLVDFWATWCGPCVAELPNVQKAYEKYHAKGFEIIGISLDREKDALTSFIKDRKMAWPQFFDGEGKLATKYGIESIPSTYLIDAQGKIITTNLRGPELEAELAKALK